MDLIKSNLLIVGGDSLIGMRLVNKCLTQKSANIFSIIRKKKFANHPTILEKFDLRTKPTKKHNYLFMEKTSIVFLSGITNTQFIQDNYQFSKEINVQHTLKWIKFLTQNGTPIVFPSSSLVYSEQLYAKEAARTVPNSAYGQFKLEVEEELQQLGVKVSLPRFTKIVSLEQPLFQNWIKSLQKKEKIEAFVDCSVSPISLDHAVEVLTKLAVDSKLQDSGTINISGFQDVTFFKFAQILAKTFDLNQELVVNANSSGNFVSKQIFAALDVSKAKKKFNYCPQTIDQVLNSLKLEVLGRNL